MTSTRHPLHARGRASRVPRTLLALAAAALLAACGAAARPPARTWEGHISFFVPQTEPGVRAESFESFQVDGDPTLYRLKYTSRMERVGFPDPKRRRARDPLYRITGHLLDARTIAVDVLEYVGGPPRPEVDYQLAEAVEHEDLAAVRTALAAHANPNTLDLLDQAPVLPQSCNVDIVLAMLAAGGDPRLESKHGGNALGTIVRCERRTMVDDARRLLEAGVPANPTGGISSPLHDALYSQACQETPEGSKQCKPLVKLLLAHGATFNRNELASERTVFEYKLQMIVD